MESDVIQIATVSGDITSKSVKADSIHLQSQSGDIACNKSIQGNINLQSESGVYIIISKKASQIYLKIIFLVEYQWRKISRSEFESPNNIWKY